MSAAESCDMVVLQEHLVSKNLHRRSVALVPLSRSSSSRTRSVPRLLVSRSQRSAANRLGRQRQALVRSQPLRSGVRQRHCLERRFLRSVHRQLQPLVRHRRRLLSEHRHRRLRLGRQLLRSGEDLGRVRLRLVRVARPPSGARRRLPLLVSPRLVWWEWHVGCNVIGAGRSRY